MHCRRHAYSATMLADFGAFNARNLKRVAQGMAPDEPLVEEMRGLAVLGVLTGGVLLPLISGGGLRPNFFGALLGYQLGPMLGVVTGPRGDQLRAAGWEAWRYFETARKRTTYELAALDDRYDLRGRWSRFDAPGRWTRFDGRLGVTDKARAIGARLLVALRAVGARVGAYLERRGIAAKARKYWRETGIPKRWREFQQEQILKAQMRGGDVGGGRA